MTDAAHGILAISDAVQFALVGILGTFVLTATPALVAILWSISRKIDRVEKQTNGRLSEAESKIKKVEKLSPGLIDEEIPAGHELTITRVINNPLTSDPPITISRVTTPPQLPPSRPESSPPEASP